MIWKLLTPASGVLTRGLTGHAIDNHVRSTIFEPEVGSILYCDLVFGSSEHSGVYLGDREIMHLNRHGTIEIVSPETFIADTTAMSIYVSCRNGVPVGSKKAGELARTYQKSIKKRKYNVLLDNCHQFSAACLCEDPDNAINFLWMLKDEAEKCLNANEWRAWERPWKVSKTSPYVTHSAPENLSREEIRALISAKQSTTFELERQSIAVEKAHNDLLNRLMEGDFRNEQEEQEGENKMNQLCKDLDEIEVQQQQLWNEIDSLAKLHPDL